MVGSRRRTLLSGDGEKNTLIIRRLQCRDCRRISHELPDIIVPYKRYDSDVIAKVLEQENLTDGDCPAEFSTIQKWKLWFFLLREYLEGSVRALMELWQTAAFIRLPLYPLSMQPDGWLKVLVRNLVNSGRWKHTRLA